MNTPCIPIRSFDGAPSFHHPEAIRPLYENDFHIDRQLLRDILALPRETLLDDLAAVLDDARNRYEVLAKAAIDAPDDEFFARELSFALHAMLLLQEIDCPRAFDLALAFLASENADWIDNQAFVDFWLGDHLTESLWQVFFRLGKGREQELADFVFMRGLDIYSVNPATTALEQIALHHPERARDIQRLFETVFQGFLAENDEEAAVDAELVAMVLENYATTSPYPVSPLVRELFQNEMVDESVCGDYDELMEVALEPLENRIRKCLDVVSLYDDVVDNWGRRISDPLNYRSEDDLDDSSECDAPQPYIAEPKIGRNDPCPCGSGKKYKKCCLK